MSSGATISLVRVRRIPHARELVRLRSQAALVRALLEELDRLVPFENEEGAIELGAQLTDEMTQLGRRVLECAATMGRPPSAAPPPLGDASDAPVQALAANRR